MNNRVQQKFDSSGRQAAQASGTAAANDRAVKARWARMDRVPSVIATAPTANVDALIAELVARDGLVAE